MRGHIQPRGPDRWRIHVNLGYGPDGKRRSRTVTVHGDRAEAEKTLTRELLEVDEGRHSATPGSVARLAERWVDANEAKWAPNTRSVHRSALDRHILPALGDIQVRKLRGADLDRLYSRLARNKLGPATIQRVHVVARSMLAQAVKWGELGVNPALAASPPSAAATEVCPPDPDEVRVLIAEADRRDPDLACFLRLAAASGARRSELCALRWGDLDLARGQMTISKALSAAGPADGKTKNTKTGGRRRLGLDPATVAALTAHRERMVTRAAACSALPGPWVFSADEAGRRPWHPSSVSHRFLRVARAAKIDVKLHSLRHFNATRLLDAGVPLIAVAHRLGHRRTSTTTDLYGHWVPDSDTAAVQAIGDVLDG